MRPIRWRRPAGTRPGCGAVTAPVGRPVRTRPPYSGVAPRCSVAPSRRRVAARGRRRLSRRCRAGPRPRTVRGPCRQLGADGPTTRIRAPRPGRPPRPSRASSWRCSVRSWVAQAVDSACSTSSPSRSDSGVQWSAMSGADQLGPAAQHRGVGQPRRPARGPATPATTSRPNGCGSRSSGPGPDQPAPAPAQRRPAPRPARSPAVRCAARCAEASRAARSASRARSAPRAPPVVRPAVGCRCPQGWGQLAGHRTRRAVRAARRAVVLPRQSPPVRSYPQYPQLCPQAGRDHAVRT